MAKNVKVSLDLKREKRTEKTLHISASKHTHTHTHNLCYHHGRSCWSGDDIFEKFK